ncbi:DUF2339 domain-containing protein [Parerythrobacter aestuarii]|uniref:DUF2339 domain-containing protein n=1 Tax=Parerythrobacter aestuarii TaxID=3020909 RepID=UPI0024DE65C5|nr:DUF2339 domain-containing protein [Parerythrobacter aestuarii]
MEFGFLILLLLFYVIGLPIIVFVLGQRLRRSEDRLAEIEHWLREPPEQPTSQQQPTVAPTPPVEPETEPERARPEEPVQAETASTEEPPFEEPPTEPERALAYAAPEAPAQSRDMEEQESRDSGFSLPKLDFEDLFGRRLPIWLGGITLAVAGMFAVAYSIEQGLLTPAVRVLLSFLFGAALLAGAELAYRNEDRIADERVRQALAGAGIATLYAAFYLAGSQYGLIGQAAAFLGLAAVTASSIALSFRFGLPSAVLGLVGGFAAPMLVGGEEANLPVLALYLGLVTGGLCFTGKQQGRAWLGIAALVGGLGWGAILVFSGDFGFSEVLALGIYFIVLGTVLPALVEHDRFTRPLRAAGAFVASLQLAILVNQAGHEPLAWGLYLLLGATIAWFGWQREDMRIAAPVAALIGVLLFAFWPAPDPVHYTLVGAGLALVFAGVPLALVQRGRDGVIEWGMVVLVPVALAAAAYGTFGAFEQDLVETGLAAATLALAALPACAAFLVARRDSSALFAGFTGIASALLFAAGLMVTPGWSAPLVAAAALAAPCYLAHNRREQPLHILLWIGAAATLVALMATSGFAIEAERLAMEREQPGLLHALLRWAAVSLPLLALCLLEKSVQSRRVAEIGAALFTYGLAAQAIPADALAWTAALAAIVLHFVQRERAGAYATWTAIAFLWAVYPLGIWLEAALNSLIGDPILTFSLPDLRQLALRIMPAALALGSIRYAPVEQNRVALPTQWFALPIGLVVLHMLYRQLFGIATMTEFTSLGMAERTVWEAALVAAAWIAANGVPRLGANTKVAIALALAALGHFALYSLWWHNPMTADQAVGSTPVANLFLAGYAVAITACLLLRRWLPELARPAVDGAIMFFATLGALALLRQTFGGTTPFDVPLSQTEDLLRSLVGIVMALVFLWLGARLQQRSWRIGSLVIMLAAVMKVFLVDASGLEGLLRIASFAAAGASLIGLGWFYTRLLKGSARA